MNKVDKSQGRPSFSYSKGDVYDLKRRNQCRDSPSVDNLVLNCDKHTISAQHRVLNTCKTFHCHVILW